MEFIKKDKQPENEFFEQDEFLEQDYEVIKQEQELEEITREFEEITRELEEKNKEKVDAEKEKAEVENYIKILTERLATNKTEAAAAAAAVENAKAAAAAAAAAVEDAKAAATSDPIAVATAMDTLRKAKNLEWDLEDDVTSLLAIKQRAEMFLNEWTRDLNSKNKRAVRKAAEVEEVYQRRKAYIEQMNKIREKLYQAGGRRYKSKRHNRISKRHNRISKRHNRTSKRHNRTSKRHNRISKRHKVSGVSTAKVRVYAVN